MRYKIINRKSGKYHQEGEITLEMMRKIFPDLDNMDDVISIGEDYKDKILKLEEKIGELEDDLELAYDSVEYHKDILDENDIDYM